MVPVRALIATAALVAALLAAPATGAAQAQGEGEQARPLVTTLRGWSPGVAAAERFVATRPGRVRFSVLDETTGRRWGLRAWEPVHSASLFKTLLLATYLRQGSVRGRDLTAAERSLLNPMIRRSENDPASELYVRLGAERIARTARAAGMGTVRPSPHWGATPTTARQQVRLFASLPALIPERHRVYAMRLLRTVVPSQRWGVGAVDLPGGWSIAFKGGWGSGTGAVDHQSALLVHGEARLVLSITTTANPSHAVGKATLLGVARRLLAGLPG